MAVCAGTQTAISSSECAAGLVISGKTDPANPLFTKGGSAWTNDSFPILDLPSYQDPRLNPRNQCIHHGYASIALIPIRNKERIIGLIHINDRQKGRFTLNTIELLEDIASHIGSALLRKQTEKSLSESEIQYRTLYESAGDAIFLLDEDVFIACNIKALEMFRHREQIVGQPPYLFSPEVQPDGRNSKEKALEKNNAVRRGAASIF